MSVVSFLVGLLVGTFGTWATVFYVMWVSRKSAIWTNELKSQQPPVEPQPSSGGGFEI